MIRQTIVYICTKCKRSYEQKPVACPVCDNEELVKTSKVITKGA